MLAQSVKPKTPSPEREYPMFGGAEPPSSFSGYEPKKLFHATRGGTFEECSFAEGFESRADGRSLVTADLDGDGDLDVLMTNRNAPRLQLWENVAKNGSSLELTLESVKGHREADGAVVKVDGLGAFPVLLARGYASTVDPTVHVGLGPATSATVRVRWRSGVEERFGQLAAGSRYVLKEGTGKALASRAFSPPRVVTAPGWPRSLEGLLGAPAQGQVTVVQLFMQSCKPCRDEVAALNALERRGVRVLGLGLHAAQELPAVKKAMGMKYPVAPLTEAVAAAFEGPAGLVLPTVLVYGADGQLARVVAGGGKVGAVLSELGLK